MGSRKSDERRFDSRIPKRDGSKTAKELVFYV